MHEYNVYYKDTDKKLCCVKVGSVQDSNEAIMAVRDMLATSQQAFLNQSVLALIKGGSFDKRP